MVNGIILPGQNEIYQQTWCNYKLLPIPYSYVQDKYWNVGFFKYYQLKQIPNFLLALPIICLILLQSYYFFKYNWHYIVHHSMFVKFLLRNFGGNNYLRRQKYAVESKFEIDFAFPCILHALALTIFCIIFVHIQVTTRMLCSASPVIYWFSNQVNKRFIKYYYLCYFYVGTIMFCNFLPWT
ncbi:PREDICTED: GPI mannosyltransferase 2 [Nicrophorus vespilloides]|uniref:GPI mannosyltransferase 2 n=1 Tax=Nicrophorus vespilloides TaxID=110193 RepID=A0ABM1NJ09_NICVS|nr:PREDICTED: GPI mannosyltransferase 2 [Nicrophorus vespilloides]